MNNRYTRYILQRVKIIFLILIMLNILLLITLIGAGKYTHIYFLAALLGVIMLAIILYIAYKWIVKPYKENAKVLELFVRGYTIQDVFDQRVLLTPQIESTLKKFKEIMYTNELISATKKQAQYLALQNQINPHFLYNTLEGIRGETLMAGLDHVAEMTEALATFFRYTISNVENLVSLENELSNIENYYIIQQYRFGERLSMNVVIDSEDEDKIMKYKLPKLTLQPIVENSIYHGIERKIGRGSVDIKIETTGKRLIITISDDGLGIEKKHLMEVNSRLIGTSLDYIKEDGETKGGIAMMNVNNRIKLLFGEEYGIYIYSTLGSGTDVEITLPIIEE